MLRNLKSIFSQTCLQHFRCNIRIVTQQWPGNEIVQIYTYDIIVITTVIFTGIFKSFGIFPFTFGQGSS